MKYILVSGGVISGVGKGVISSSIGTLLKAEGLNVTSIKIDPYLNIDAGTFSPYEHGECYVLDDGGEVDLDLGNYERFLDITLTRDNNLTTGKVYQAVIEKERRGDYLGKTVQVVPHVTNEIQEHILRVAKICTDGSGTEPDVCIIELGGVVGDIESMPFVEAFRQFQFRVKKENFLLLHVSLVPQTSSDSEQKTKPTQHSVRELRGLGLSPDILVCRGIRGLEPSVKEKLSNFCHVAADQVLSVHDCSSIYRVPLLLQSQGILEIFRDHLNIQLSAQYMASLQQQPDDGPRIETEAMTKWRDLADRYDALTNSVDIVLVGKYTALSDAYASVIKALRHSCLKAGHKLNLRYVEATDLEKEMLDVDPGKYHEAWTKICSSTGILVPGGFGTRGIEGKIAAAKWAREKKIPYLGVCLGFQVAVIETCRNVLGWEGANSVEVDPDTKHPVVVEMPEISTSQLGGTMRLGKRRTIFTTECLSKQLYYDQDSVEERHRHRYEVNPESVADIEKAGLKFVGRDTEGERMEIFELDGHPFFCGVQYHPEYLSRPMRPAPMFFGFILASCGKLKSWLKKRPATPSAPMTAATPTQSPESIRRQQSPVRRPIAIATPSPLKAANEAIARQARSGGEKPATNL